MRNYCRKYVLLLSLIIIPVLLFAQAGGKTMYRGVVTSAQDRMPLPMAHVVMMNKDGRIIATAVTDMDGNYSLMAVPMPGNTLVMSYAGFKKKSLPVGQKVIYSAALEENAIQVKEVVVTAKKQMNTGMMNIAERDLTVSATKIDAKELEGLATAGIDDALQGRVAGMDIVANSGTPGAGMSIRIRGTTSINGSSQPLIVVDGFPYETTISSDFDFATADEQQYSQMLNISPDDIKEITVLKDAAATAIYGSRAANGVLLITTKRGGISKPRVSYTLKGTYDERPKGIPTLTGDQYSTLIQEELYNAGRLYNPVTNPEFAYDVNQPYYYNNYGQNTDWYRSVTKTGLTQDHNLSISGGGEKAQYRVSLGYYDQTGTVIGTDYQRISSRLNIDYNVSSKMKFQGSMSYTHGLNNRNYISYLDSKTDVSAMAFARMPNMSVYEYDEVGALTGNYFSPLTTPQGYWNSNAAKGGVYNPVAMANEGTYKIISDRVISNLSLIYSPLPTLRYQFDVGLDVMNDKTKAFLPQTATGRPWNEISVNRSDDIDAEAFILQTFHKLIYTPELGKDHAFQMLLGVNTYDKTSQSYKATTGNGASPYLDDPSIAARVANNSILGIWSGSTESRTASVFANVHYSLLDRYIVSANIRTDGSSKFGSAYRYGTFPSVSARYRFSGEPFMKKYENWLDELSFRASYGINGNQPKSDFGYLSTYGIYGYSYLGSLGTYPSNLELVNLRWEKSVQSNFGINLALFKNRINADFEIYKKRTSDLFFYGLDIPTSTGFSSVDMNAGIMDNQGWEFSINTVPVKTKNLTVGFNFNIARNQNYIRSISEMYPMESGVSTSNGDYLQRIQVNQPLGSFYGYRYKGVYLNSEQTIARDASGNKIYTFDSNGNVIPVQMKFSYPSIGYTFQPGDAKYQDINNDGNIDYKDIVYLGNANPLLTGGFGPNIRYKQFTVSAFFNFRYGNKIVNATKMNLESMYDFDNSSTATLKRWRHSYDDPSTAPSDLIPRAMYGSGYNYLGSNRYVENGSFVRFKSLTMKYNLDKKFLKHTFINDCNFWITMQNLYVWTKYTGMDPEVSIGGSDPFKLGYDNSVTPRSKEVSLGVNLSF
jgi:TonB-linked outer membrane protein, SusC/RagA family